MQIRRYLFSLAITFAALMVFSGHSFSAPIYTVCSPAKSTDTGAIIRFQFVNCLQDPSAGMGGWMTLSATNAARKRAIIATAMSLGRTIYISFDNAVQDVEGYNYILSASLSE